MSPVMGFFVVKEAVLEAAREYNYHMTELWISTEYPETIEW